MKVPGLSKRNIQMINPKTGGRRGQAEQDFQTCSATTFSATDRLPASGLRAVAAGTRVRPAGAPHPAPRPRQAAPPGPGKAEHLGTAHRERPAGRWLRGTGSSGRPRPLQCNLGGFSRSLPASFRAQSLPPRRLRAGERGLGTRGEGRARAGPRGPFPSTHSAVQERKARSLELALRTRTVPSTLVGRRSAASPQPSPASARSLGTRAATCAAGGRASARTVAPGKRSRAAPGCSSALLPAPGKLSRSPRCPRFLAVGNARSPASPHTHPDRFFDLYPEWVPAVSVCLPDFTP